VTAGDRALALLSEGAREGAWPAAVLLAARGDEVLFRGTAGYGRDDSVFDVASLTKPLVAILFFSLVQQGVLEPEGFLRDALPGTAFSPGGEAIRFRHLLSHTSGLPAWRPFHEELAAEEGEGAEAPRGAAEAYERVVALAAASPLEHPPGEGWRYSDLGYILLGRAVEWGGFHGLDRLLARHVLAPLGMADTAFLPPGRPLPFGEERIVPTGWSEVRGREKRGEVDDENCAAVGGVAGHAGLFSTADDLDRFAREVRRAAAGEGRVLLPRWARRMTERVAGPAGCPRTEGFDTPTPAEGAPSQAGEGYPPGTVGHLGYTGCSLWFDPAPGGATVVLLTNRVAAREGKRDLIRKYRPAIHTAAWEALAGR
jgi:CubicO group peptidase (beta-lactamase class C family)